jgi:transposase-like protein
VRRAKVRDRGEVGVKEKIRFTSSILLKWARRTIGATPEGKKELVGFQAGVRESAQSWRELLVDLKRRGLEIAPDLAVGDGALGFWKAIEEIFPGTRHQRCWVHKTANVLNKVALSPGQHEGRPP